MKKQIVVVSAILLSCFVFSETVSKKEPISPEQKAANKARFERAVYRRTGGSLKEPGVQKGRIVYVNAQKEVPAEFLKGHAGVFADMLKIAIDVEDGTFELANPKVVGNATLFVVDDPKLPMSLVAPESRWVMVNFAPLKSEKSAFFESRIKKMLTRGFSYLAGAANSQYPNAIVGCVTGLESLDRYPDNILPYDIPLRFASYIEGYGIVPYKLVSYKKACIQGWAPAPTNDIQKAIWDGVRAKADSSK